MKKTDPFKNQKLSAYEKAVDASVERGEWKPVTDATRLAEVKAGLARLRDERAAARGGARPGAGRKPKDTRPVSLRLTPAAREKLEKLAKREPGGMSGVVNRLIAAAK